MLVCWEDAKTVPSHSTVFVVLYHLASHSTPWTQRIVYREKLKTKRRRLSSVSSPISGNVSSSGRAIAAMLGRIDNRWVGYDQKLGIPLLIIVGATDGGRRPTSTLAGCHRSGYKDDIIMGLVDPKCDAAPTTGILSDFILCSGRSETPRLKVPRK